MLKEKGKNLKMPSGYKLKEINEYIQKELSKGLNDNQIMKLLIKSKWPKDVALKLISEYHNNIKNEITKKNKIQNRPKRIKKFTTGVDGFDDLLKEGLPEGNAIIVEGGPGSGKTIFCLNVIHEACRKGKKCLFMSFEEPEDRLRDHMKDFGFEPIKYESKGLLRIKRFNALDIARSVEALLSEAKKELLIELHPVLIPKDFAPDLLVIDSLSSISSAFTGEKGRFRIYMEQLFRYLESNNITSFLIREEAHPAHLKSNYNGDGEEISFLSDGIITIYNVVYPNGKRGRALEILKMRGENIKREIVEMKIIDKKGIKVFPNKNIGTGSLLT